MAYLTEKTSILLPARVVQTGKVLHNSLYINDMEQEAVIAMNNNELLCLLN